MIVNYYNSPNKSQNVISLEETKSLLTTVQLLLEHERYDYKRFDQPFVAVFLLIMICMSMVLTDILRKYTRLIPREDVTVLTLLRDYLVESMNFVTCMGLSPYLMRLIIYPFPWIVAEAWVMAILLEVCVVTALIASIFSVKIIIICWQGYIESMNAFDLSPRIFLCIKAFCFAPHFTIFLYVVYWGKKFSSGVLYLANINEELSEGLNPYMLLIIFLTVLAFLVAVVETIINCQWNVIQLSKLKYTLLGFLMIIFVWLFDHYSSKSTHSQRVPFTISIFPIIYNSFLSYLVQIEYGKNGGLPPLFKKYNNKVDPISTSMNEQESEDRKAVQMEMDATPSNVENEISVSDNSENPKEELEPEVEANMDTSQVEQDNSSKVCENSPDSHFQPARGSRTKPIVIFVDVHHEEEEE